MNHGFLTEGNSSASCTEMQSGNMHRGQVANGYTTVITENQH